ncbi:DUF1764-domain-containing protein [Macrolepiota fuliginosa MF-IS2]|uniref:DUF1764-domain-containing protein n=1 Tax=Macrolepiota fuliginosa MF-IS2 TaxID=1400762 RepID=A0A9P5XJI1_9AGAR|nr:DUF1764-domain-containing protein [Macrolepiota fuliginosa MF-IS2]
MSEIDDIFASKGKAKAPPPSESPLVATRKKKKDKKKKLEEDISQDVPKENPAPPKKRPHPETIVDPSTLPNSSKRHKTNPNVNVSIKQPKKDSQEEEQFKDSRGNGPRRKTEEGWSIYKEDELGLSHEGGDTPLCPFDCDCCF